MPVRSPRAVGSPFVIRAPVLLALRDAEAVRAAAVKDTAQLRASAAAESAASQEAARADSAAAAAALLASAAAAADAFLAAREAELVELAFAIAHRLVADLPSDARAVALARTALAEHRDGSRLALRAPPATASVLRAAFAAHGNLEVRDDDTLGPDECVLLHPGGRTELGPLQQLRALMAASVASDPAR